MLAQHLLIGLALALPYPGWSQAIERKVTFHIEPSGAEVFIANHMGGYDKYPVQKERWVKFPSPALNLEVQASGWKREIIPINVNQFSDQWPASGTLQLKPDSWQAHLQMLPRWPLLLFAMVPLAYGLRKKRSLIAQPAAPVPTPSLPWELSPGEKFADYQVLERLGEGVSAVVYRVASQDGDLALKLLKPQHFRDSEVLPRFRREMKALCRLRHSSIPFLVDFGEHRGMNYLAMELLSSRSLQDSLKEGPLSPQQALPVLRQIAEALVVCHGQGILHRDIKPENVVWGKDGKVRLTDFGLARPHDASTLTVEGSLLGTPAYMAPEIAQGLPTSPQTDLYSLGCLAYHLCSGAPPFSGESPLAVLMQHLSAEPPPIADCPPGLQAWIDGCLKKTAQERFASASQALQRLDQTSLE